MLASFVAANAAGPSLDYAKAYAAARAKAYRLDIAARRQIVDVYQKAADEAAAVVQDAIERGLSELTTTRWQVIAAKLQDAADEIARGTETTTRSVITSTASLFAEIDKDYIWAAAKVAGATSRITQAGLLSLVASVNKNVVASLSTRLWSDGYTFSQRVWGASGLKPDWLNSIKMTVASGIAQGRDPVRIARDIQVYTKDGKVALLDRWGNLERGTAEFAKRIPKNIDYRAARLVRSELNASLQDAEVLSGQTNPAGTGEYDWILSPIHSDVWGCECSSLAAGGPYTVDNIPTYPHPNCFCPGPRLKLRDHDEFMSDLTQWARGGSIDYLDMWYTDVYKAA
jgi:hypothetical protein